MTTFKELGLNSEIMKSLDDLGFTEPSPIQEKVIPFLSKSKKDLIALAQTGTGKTAAFSLPILNQIESNKRNLQAIILCPTRELCIQISEDIKKFTKYSKGISTTAVYGGARIDLQIRSLKNGTDIAVGTPGRVKDLIKRKVLKLESIKWLVLDEADEMLDMGFKDDLDLILEQTPKERQTLLFSATISKRIQSIAKQYMNEIHEINAGEKNIGADKVSHEYYVVQPRDRFETLKRILDCLPEIYGILFCRTKRETQEVADKLKQANYNTEVLNGDISQNIRTKIMDRFKRKQISLLVATDVAARGIDVSDLSHIINYNLPTQNEIYVHRSGRTGRAKKSGVSVSILTSREVRVVKSLEKIIGKNFEYKKVPNGEEVYKKQIDNFIEEIKNTNIEKIGNQKYFSEIVDRLKEIDKEDLIKHVIANKFSSIINIYKNTNDLNAQEKTFGARRETRMDDKNNINLKINFGKKQGFDVKGLFALINSNRNLKGVEIGKINLMPEHSIFSVEKERADDVLRSLNQSNFKGKKISISKSSENTSFKRSRNNKFGRGFNKKRNGFRRTR